MNDDSITSEVGLPASLQAFLKAGSIIVVGGGTPDRCGLFDGVVRLASGYQGERGTGVVIGEERRWVLSVAHCIEQEAPPTNLRIRIGPRSSPLPDRSPSVPIDAIYWQSGYRFRYFTNDVWPQAASDIVDGRDELVLLKLRRPLTASEVQHPGLILPKDPPKKPDRLVLVGWGTDDNDKHTRRAQIAVLRYAGTGRDGRGRARRVRTDLFNGMPLKFDSGSPYFLPPMSNPFGTSFYRIVGIHAGRVHSPLTVAGAPNMHDVPTYLPIGATAMNWIDRVAGNLVFPPRVAAMATEGMSNSARSPTFELRGARVCRKIADTAALANPENTSWELTETKGQGPFFKVGDRFAFEPINDTHAKMTVTRAGATTPKYTVSDGFLSGVQNQHHWFQGDANDENNRRITFLFFMVQPDSSSDPRPFHVLAYKENSEHPFPNECSIDDKDIDSSHCQGGADSGDGGGSPKPDQDDEGDGHEK